MDLFVKQSQNTVPYSIYGTDQDAFPVRYPAVCRDPVPDIPAAALPEDSGDSFCGGDDRPEYFA